MQTGNQLRKEAFAERFKALRKQRGLTQEYFEQQNIASRKSVHNWEKGQIPDVETVIKLCEVLDCDFDYLFGKIDLPHKEETDICRETGLSAEAVEKIKQFQNDSKQAGYACIETDVISAIIESETLTRSLCDYFCERSLWGELGSGLLTIFRFTSKGVAHASGTPYTLQDGTESNDEELINAINLQKLQTELIKQQAQYRLRRYGADSTAD